MSLLEERELTDDERAAIADEARPGVWIEEHEVFHTMRERPISTRTGRPIEVKAEIERRGDGRAFTQDETDTLISSELHYAQILPNAEFEELRAIVGEPMDVVIMDVPVNRARQQRGGIHSDPLVRLLAFRAWGDRDRSWFAPKLSDVAPNHPEVTAARVRKLVDRIAGEQGVSKREVIVSFRRINTNADIEPLLDEMQRDCDEADRREREREEAARRFFRPR